MAVSLASIKKNSKNIPSRSFSTIMNSCYSHAVKLFACASSVSQYELQIKLKLIAPIRQYKEHVI
jgi:hypothetical protein